MKPNLLTKGVRFYNLFKVNLKKLTDPNFNAFLRFGNDGSLEKINSREKLAFMKLIDLSKQGFINPDRKVFFQKEKELYRLMDIDQNIMNIGRLSITDDFGIKSQMYVGFNEKTKKLFVSDTHVQQVPIWKKPTSNDINKVFSSVIPDVDFNHETHKKFQFDQEFFHYDVEGLPAVLRTNLEKEFNTLADIAFKSNKYLMDKFPTLPDNFAKSFKEYQELTFKVPSSFFPQLDSDNGFVVAAFKGKDDNGYIFKPMITKDAPFLKVDKEVLEDRINDRNVELIGKLNTKIAIGVDRKNGTPQIGVKMNKSGYIWKPYAKLKTSTKLTAQEKDSITHIVDNKDFLVEKDQVMLINPNDTNENLIVKKHFSKDGLYFMETYVNRVPYSLSNFRKLSAEKANALAGKYKTALGVGQFRKLVAEIGLAKGQERNIHTVGSKTSRPAMQR